MRLLGLKHLENSNFACQTEATEIDGPPCWDTAAMRPLHTGDRLPGDARYWGGVSRNIPRYYLFRGGFCLSFRVEISTAFLCFKPKTKPLFPAQYPKACLLYTSDAADERSSVDLG